MIAKLLIVIYLLPSLNIYYVSNKPNLQEIRYSRSVNLKWSDFTPNKNIEASALSSTAISYDYTESNNSLTIAVHCIFYKKESFFLPNKKTSYLLNHEQRHFDISYIYSIIFIKKLKEYNYLTEDIVKEIYNKTISEWSSFQDEYDLATDNSQDTNMQQLWDKKIDLLLNSIK